MTEQLVPKYHAAEHWAKIELPTDERARVAMVARVRVRGCVDVAGVQPHTGVTQARYPSERFVQARAQLDPHNVLGNDLVDALFPISESNKS